MVSTAFAWQFTWGCKFEGKCSIYYLCPWFNRGVHFFCIKPVKSKFGSNLYAARALLFSSLASVISSVWESNQSAVLLVFLYWKWRQHCWSFPINHMRYHCAHLEKIPHAHMQIPRLYLVHGICSCQREASPPFFRDTVTLMAILLCSTPRRDWYRIQHSNNWCLVRIRSNWCRCLDLT